MVVAQPEQEIVANVIGTGCAFVNRECECAPFMGCRTEAEALRRERLAGEHKRRLSLEERVARLERLMGHICPDKSDDV
jgi:hypothetical protein